MSAFLRLTQLRKVFDDGTTAVRGIDLACDKGEFVVLLGPSGCGKTTTLRMIAGLETPTAGHIHVQGQEITQSPPQQRDVGFVFQFYALYPHLSVFDNIAFPLQSMEVDEASVQQRVHDMVQRLQLQELVDRRPSQLSGGDQQRVALARALVREPALWLMDEPLGTLDGERRLAMRELIRRQQLDLGVTTIYVTHDQEEAMSLADRIIVMDQGQIRQAAPPAQVYGEPADLFVAHFVGSPGMNLLSAEVEGTTATLSGGARLTLPRPTDRREITIGVRPEFVYPAEEGPLQGEVVFDELVGAHRNVYVDMSAGRIVMRRPARSERLAGTLSIDFDRDAVRLFDSSSGERL